MRIDVTQADIAAAYKSSFERAYSCHHCCPIARAARRAFNDPSASVCHDGDNRMYILSKVKLYLPPIACEFVADFDSGAPIEPIAFDV